MNAAQFVGLITSILAVVGVGVGAVVKLTRMTDAIDRLGKSMEKVLEQADELDTRVTKLEVITGGRHVRPKNPNRW